MKTYYNPLDGKIARFETQPLNQHWLECEDATLVCIKSVADFILGQEIPVHIWRRAPDMFKTTRGDFLKSAFAEAVKRSEKTIAMSNPATGEFAVVSEGSYTHNTLQHREGWSETQPSKLRNKLNSETVQARILRETSDAFYCVEDNYHKEYWEKVAQPKHILIGVFKTNGTLWLPCEALDWVDGNPHRVMALSEAYRDLGVDRTRWVSLEDVNFKKGVSLDRIIGLTDLYVSDMDYLPQHRLRIAGYNALRNYVSAECAADNTKAVFKWKLHATKGD